MSVEPTVKLYKRQRVLMALLQGFGGSLGGVDFQKYLFLFTEICQKEKSYEFVPYKFGCFSFQSYADRRRLIEFGALKLEDGWHLANSEDFISQLDDGEKNKLLLFCKKFRSKQGEELVREVYKRFPYYAINSEIAHKLMTTAEMQIINERRPKSEEPGFFTIGYEGHSFENYLNRLIENDIKTLVDVRSNPVSRKYGFSGKTLSKTLNMLGIEYIHMPELGIVSDKRKKLNTFDDYNILFKEYDSTVLKSNQDSLLKLFGLVSRKKRIAITCFEHDSKMCHRGRVAKAMEKLKGWDLQTQHI
jgi:uncharacterized protein (DUF488 family)